MAVHLPDAIRRYARERAGSAALICEGRTVDYATLDTRTNRVARALLSVAPAGSRIGLLARTRTEAAETLIAAGKAGLVTVPLNWRLSPGELTEVARDAGLRVLIAEREFLPAAHAVREALPGLPLVTIGPAADHAPNGTRDGDPGEVPGYEAWLAAHPDDDPHRGSDADGGEVFLQIYTSGTTAAPKGVLLTHDNLSADQRDLDAHLWTADSVALNALPLFHIGGLSWLRVALGAGAASLLLPDFTPASAADAIERGRVTHSFLVPSVLHMLTELPGIDRRDFSRLRLISYGAAPITPALLRRSMAVFGCRFMGKYGLTEAGGTVTQLPPDDHVADGPRRHLLKSTGRPRHGVEVVIADITTGRPVPPGTVGEIRVRSPHNTPGYWNRPRETAELFDRDGLLRTGDGGYLDENGYLHLTDRIKDMIVTGGENVYPAEVEAVLAEHPAVSEVAVIGVPHDTWGEAVTAVVVPRPDVPRPAERELIEFTRARIASYKKPHRIHFAAELPRNPGGKVLKRALRAEFGDR